MVISHNLLAMNANRQFGITTGKKAKQAERLSSGYRVNRAADDAAGLAISEKMRRQIRGLSQASTNSQDGISLIQTAEGGLNEVHAVLQRMNELSVQSANATLSEEDRSYLDEEYQALKREINRVADSTTFNEISLFPSDGSSLYTSGYDIKVNSDGTYTVSMRSDAYTVGSKTSTENARLTMDYVADLIPSITSDIVSAFPSLSGADDLSIKLDLSYIDGGYGTLAYAAYSYYNNADGTATPVTSSFVVKVDTADFTDSNALVGGDRNDLLQATLRHELTHTVMQYNLTSAMRSLPTWFKEGAAQVTGGGFSTGWISGLSGLDTEAEYSAYLKKTTVDVQPYGQGFLATAYAAYLAAGSPATVTGADLLPGLDAIFTRLKAGDSLSDAFLATTGKTEAQIKNDINKGTTDAAAFVKKYADASKKGDGTFGAGSALLSSLSAGSSLMGSVPSDASALTELTAAKEISLQTGSEAGNKTMLKLFSIGTNSLGLSAANIRDIAASEESISQVKNALSVISSIRSYYGATQNRLEHTINNLDNVVENTTASESAIRDADMAATMVEFSISNILSEAGTAMLTHANQSSQGILNLLQ